MRCIFILDEHYEVKTYWGWFRLDRGAYEDYLAGKLWITWVPGKRQPQIMASKAEDPLPPNVTAEAIRLRDLSAKQGLYATLQASFPHAQVEIPYKSRMKNKQIDEMALSVRSSNGLMRANAGTFGRLWDLMTRETGLRSVRNLGAKSEAEIKKCFFDACYHRILHNQDELKQCRCSIIFWTFLQTNYRLHFFVILFHGIELPLAFFRVFGNKKTLLG